MSLVNGAAAAKNSVNVLEQEKREGSWSDRSLWPRNCSST